jgi:hypothetical protein
MSGLTELLAQPTALPKEKTEGNSVGFVNGDGEAFVKVV